MQISGKFARFLRFRRHCAVSRRNFERIFSFGMPKCGTTTVAAMLGQHPEICLHNQKEPGDFLVPERAGRLSGYATTEKTRYLADFTTTYGTAENRSRFFSLLRSTNLSPEDMRYILCVRDPIALARSYLLHIAERKRINIGAEMYSVRHQILCACDMEGAMDALIEEAGPSRVFLVRFDDLLTEEGQCNLARQLYGWLGVSQIPLVKPLWENSQGSLTLYPRILVGVAASVRNTDLVRNLQPHLRGSIRRLLSRPARRVEISRELIEDTLGWLEKKATFGKSVAFVNSTRSGPLDLAVNSR